jgi:hypothetical protein
MTTMAYGQDETGRAYGRLTVLYRNRSVPVRSIEWWCRCECGTLVSKRIAMLRAGRTKSCGCLKREQALLHQQTYKRKQHPLHARWKTLRCRAKHSGTYFEPTWNRFDQFLADMGEPPTMDYFMGVIHPRQGYRKGNCFWTLNQTDRMQNHAHRDFGSSWTREEILQCIDELEAPDDWPEPVRIPWRSPYVRF